MDYKVDNLDQSILTALKGNARETFAKIGREVGLTAPAVAQRIQKMESAGIIKGYEVVLDQAKLGNDIAAMITLKCPYGKIQAFSKQLAIFSEIEQCLRVTGEDCVVLHALLRNNQHLVELLERLAEYGESKTAIILKDMLAD